MKLNLKRITSSFIVAMTFAQVQPADACIQNDGLSDSYFDNSVNNIRPSARDDTAAKTPKEAVLASNEVHIASFGGQDRNVLQNILTRVADDGETKPGDLRLVCRHWKENIDIGLPKHKDGSLNLKDIFYKDLSRVWQRIVQTAYGGLEHKDTYDMLAKVALVYKAGREGVFKYEELPFLDMKNPFNGVLNLPDSYRGASQILITTSVDEFFKVNEEDKSKLIILVSPYGAIKNLYAARFGETTADWDPTIAPIGMFFRFGNWKDLSWFDARLKSLENLSGTTFQSMYMQSKILVKLFDNMEDIATFNNRYNILVRLRISALNTL